MAICYRNLSHWDIHVVFPLFFFLFLWQCNSVLKTLAESLFIRTATIFQNAHIYRNCNECYILCKSPIPSKYVNSFRLPWGNSMKNIFLCDIKGVSNIHEDTHHRKKRVLWTRKKKYFFFSSSSVQWDYPQNRNIWMEIVKNIFFCYEKQLIWKYQYSVSIVIRFIAW